MSDDVKQAHGPRGPDNGASSTAPEPLSPDLVARLAHELKTPLSAIAAASEIMRDERFGPIGDARYRGYASDIHNSARHALELVSRMLARRTPGADEPELAFVEIDLAKLIADVVSALRPLAEPAHQSLAATLPPRLPHVIADATSLRQILINLLTNATRPRARSRSRCAIRVAAWLRLSSPTPAAKATPRPSLIPIGASASGCRSPARSPPPTARR